MRPLAAFLFCVAGLQAATYFEPNQGQAPARLQFTARTRHGAAGLAAGQLDLRRRDGRHLVMWLDGARAAARPLPEGPLPGVSHYANGRDPSRWIWSVPHYTAVRYSSVYPGIDVLYRSQADDLEFDFLLSPQADASLISLGFSLPAELDSKGRLSIGGTLLHAPVAWQQLDGRRVPVDARFVLKPGGRASFHLGAYDRTRPLTIDPVVQFATFLGGSDNEADPRVAVSSDGALYLAGSTLSVDFPAELLPGSVLNHPQYLLAPDVFVTRIKEDGSTLEWSLFIGGSGDERAQGLQCDPFGNLLLLGSTTSPNFPVTGGAYRTRIAQNLGDQFVVKLDGKTGRIKAATFLGTWRGDSTSSQRALLSTDPAGGVYVLGEYGSGFTTTAGAFLQVDPSGYRGWFLMRLNAALSARVYSTALDIGVPSALVVDSTGSAIVGGTWSGANPFPAVNPIPGVDQAPTARNQGYVARLNPQGSALLFASLLHAGGPSSSIGDLRLGPGGNIEVLGYAEGPNFPRIRPLDLGDAEPPTIGRAPFLATIPAEGGALLQSTFLDQPSYAPAGTPHLAVRASGKLCMLGMGSARLLQTPGGLGTAVSSQQGGLLCTNDERTGFDLKSALPGQSTIEDMLFLPDGSLALAGTAIDGFAATAGAAQSSFGGGLHQYRYDYSLGYGDTFLLKLSLENPAPLLTHLTPAAILLDLAGPNKGTLDFYGTGFAFGASVTRDRETALAPTFLNSTHLSIEAFDFSSLHAGPNLFSVSLPGPGGGSSEVELQGWNATPERPTLNPALVTQGAGELKVVARGRGIRPDSVLLWDGAPRAAQFGTDVYSRSGLLETLVSAEEVAVAGTHRVAIRNPPPGGGDSIEVAFAVQSAGGTPVPVLAATLGPLAANPDAPDNVTITVGGTGFTESTQADWDGSSVPVKFVSSTSIRVSAPPDHLRRWGVHQLSVRNGELQSGFMRVFVGQSILGRFWMPDAAGRRLYGLSWSYTDNASNLLIVDAESGTLLQTVTTGLFYGTSLAVSDDGRYVYCAGANSANGAPFEIVRFDTEASAIDLRWEPRDSGGALLLRQPTLLSIPGRPATVAASFGDKGTFLFDDGVTRWGSSPQGQIVFATGSRIYFNTPRPGCWMWMDYDDSGVTATTGDCRTALPPDAVADSGLIYLNSGPRSLLVTTPSLASLFQSGYINSSLAIQPGRRRAFALFGGSLLLEFDLETGRQPQLLLPSYYSSGRTLLALTDRVLAVDSSWLVPLF